MTRDRTAIRPIGTGGRPSCGGRRDLFTRARAGGPPRSSAPLTRGGRRMRVRLIAPLTAALVAGVVGLTAPSAAAAPAPAAAPTAGTARATLTNTINQEIPG